MSQTQPIHGSEAAHVEIRINGGLDTRWSAWFDGLTVTPDGATTVLHGQVTDQAALFGLFHKLRDVALPLISISVEFPVAGRGRRRGPRGAAG